jgi:hypothetical protein
MLGFEIGMSSYKFGKLETVDIVDDSKFPRNVCVFCEGSGKALWKALWKKM